MGFFWDLLQQYQIGQQRTASGTTDERVAQLERDIAVDEQIIQQMAKRLDQLEDALYAEGEQNG
jgi:hypothetical protein